MASTIKVDTIENVAGSGNVSLGSGHNLVVPGDLTVDTTSLKVDSSNNRVGIGTATPSDTVDALGNLRLTTNSSTTRRVYALSGTGAYALNSSGGAAIAFHRDSGNNDEIAFETHTQGSAHAENMRIDKSGHITMSKQPAFMAFKVGNQSVGTSTVQVTGWNNNLDVGSNWDNTQNRYTVPTAGIYLAGGFYQANQSTGLHFGILKNGAAYGNDSYLDMVAGAANGYSVPFQMAVNDYFTWIAYCSSSSLINANRSKIWVIKVA